MEKWVRGFSENLDAHSFSHLLTKAAQRREEGFSATYDPHFCVIKWSFCRCKQIS
jgi:hypothetical protein